MVSCSYCLDELGLLPQDLAQGQCHRLATGRILETLAHPELVRTSGIFECGLQYSRSEENVFARAGVDLELRPFSRP